MSRYRQRKNFPRSRAAFDKLQWNEKRIIKTDLLTDNTEQFMETMSTECIDDLARLIGRRSQEKYKKWDRYDGKYDAISGLLLELPRCGDYWWEELEQVLQRRGYHGLFRCMNPWENDPQDGASGAPPPPPPPSLPQDPAQGATSKDEDILASRIFRSVASNPEIARALANALQDMTNPQQNVMNGSDAGRMSRLRDNQAGATAKSFPVKGKEMPARRVEVAGTPACASSMPELPRPPDAHLPENIVPEDEMDEPPSLTDNEAQPITATAGGVTTHADEKVLNTVAEETGSNRNDEAAERDNGNLPSSSDQPRSGSADAHCESPGNAQLQRERSGSLQEDGSNEQVSSANADCHQRRDDGFAAPLPLESLLPPTGQRSPGSLPQMEGADMAEARGQVTTTGGDLDGQTPSIHIHVEGSVNNLILSKTNTMKKQVSTAGSSFSRVDQCGQHDTPDAGESSEGSTSQEEEDPTSVQLHSFVGQETAAGGSPGPSFTQETSPLQQHGSFGHGLTDTASGTSLESNYYPPWDLEAHETAPKTAYVQQETVASTDPEANALEDVACPTGGWCNETSFVDLNTRRGKTDAREFPLDTSLKQAPGAEDQALTNGVSNPTSANGFGLGREACRAEDLDGSVEQSGEEDERQQEGQRRSDGQPPRGGGQLYAFWSELKDVFMMLE